MNIENIMNNWILNSDSYKLSHHLLYPKNRNFTHQFSYLESRGGEFNEILFFGLQIFEKDYLTKPITQEMIEQADEFTRQHMGPNIFNREGWQYILDTYNGYLPLKICAVPEGTLIPVSNILLSVENTDEKVPWLTSFVETQILRGIWYPTTVATLSYHIKQIIKQYLLETADTLDSIGFGLLDFGARGCTSLEANAIGGCAHLVNFKGSDSLMGIAKAMKIYHTEMPAFSVSATEHSVMCSYGKDNELESFKSILEAVEPNTTISIVGDTWDIFEACKKMVTLKDIIRAKKLTYACRPDSGDPEYVLPAVYDILSEGFGSYINSKGYRVMNNVKILWGDGIEYETIDPILCLVKSLGFSTETIMLGSGGGLLQRVDRDTCKMAYKASAVNIDGEWKGISKNPITDSVKKSKEGRLMLYRNLETGSIFTSSENLSKEYGFGMRYKKLLEPVFENGKILKEYTFSEIIANSGK